MILIDVSCTFLTHIHLLMETYLFKIKELWKRTVLRWSRRCFHRKQKSFSPCNAIAGEAVLITSPAITHSMQIARRRNGGLKIRLRTSNIGVRRWRDASTITARPGGAEKSQLRGSYTRRATALFYRVVARVAQSNRKEKTVYGCCDNC